MKRAKLAYVILTKTNNYPKAFSQKRPRMFSSQKIMPEVEQWDLVLKEYSRMKFTLLDSPFIMGRQIYVG